MNDYNVSSIQIITNLGPRIFNKGQEFDYVQINQEGEYIFSYTLWKDNKPSHFIHHSVPVVLDYYYEQ